MTALLLLRRHWLPVLLLIALGGQLVRTASIDADRDAQRELASTRGRILEASVSAVGAANGWTAAKRLKVEQLPLQIQLYGNAFREIREARARAAAEDLRRARAIEARDLKIATEKQDAITTRLAAELRRADDYARARRMRAAGEGRAGAGDPGGGRAADLSAAAQAAGDPARAGDASVLDDDVRICTTNTVKAEGWGEYWREVFSAPR
ncbi:hypothetical protein CA223_05540 [Sphingomonas koreensis]|uniref:Uncharacterized protein n=1 Tax=Sphingomonas koreensis TaxID=93064 RepID=A0A1L6JBR9_9SPHN|nr:hypothetical protein [Sphingomonas koreensis]APR53374.1 hypothetical protein BRX40_13895 [Sphingomonas koreensis]MDC7809940.1 hypothetical protein [Sphingomonas koreensis]RSU24503.1 hypothetical protein CA224_01945 [Sphingomonas koreensis]RSU25148.1 hypothetical protein CA222_13535 [Sphingomonas koreensis]RSU30177.1 hypothetical protein CA225_05815 [Sphingomonas koreensis]